MALSVSWWALKPNDKIDVVAPTESPSDNLKQAEKIIATIKTNRGDIVLELYPPAAPKTVENFINLSRAGFYNGTKFHRVVPEFVIQGGDPLSKNDNPSDDGTGGPGYAFEDEINPKALGLGDAEISRLEAAGYKYNFELKSLPVTAGAIAMANSGPNTNGSQFFIVTTKDQPYLNGKHTVFGKVISGMDVVKKIQQGDEIKTIKLSL